MRFFHWHCHFMRCVFKKTKQLITIYTIVLNSSEKQYWLNHNIIPLARDVHNIIGSRHILRNTQKKTSESERSPQVHKSVLCILGIKKRRRKNASSQTVWSVQCARHLASSFFQGWLARTLLLYWETVDSWHGAISLVYIGRGRRRKHQSATYALVTGRPTSIFLSTWRVVLSWCFQTLCLPLRAGAVEKRHWSWGIDSLIRFNCARSWRRPTNISSKTS